MGKRAHVRMEGHADLDSWPVYKRLFGYTWQHRNVFLIGIISGVVWAALEASAVKYMEFVFEVIIEQKEKHYLTVPLLLVAIATLRGIANFLNNYCMSYVGNHITHSMRQEIAAKYLRLPLRFFHESNAGELVSRLTYNTGVVVRAATAAPTIVVREAGTVVFVLAFLMYTNWALTLMFLLSAPFIAFILGEATKRFKHIAGRIQSSMGNVTQITNEIVIAQQVIKVYGGQHGETERFIRASNRNRQQSTKLSATKALNTSVVQIVIAIFSALLVGMAVHPDVLGTMDPPQFVGFLTGVGLLVKPIRQLTNINPDIQSGIIAAHSVFSLLDMPEEVDTGTQDVVAMRGEVVFRNVVFRYPGTEKVVLNDFSLEVPAGKTVALVGRSGAGKTTVSNLVPRFYNPESGAIFIDGIDIRDIRLASLRNNIAIVSQKVFMFNCSIRDNIAYGLRKEATLDEVREAARLAYADDFIMALPEGYDTFVGDDGVQLSGGQRQRIAIARAILKDAPILILDEATSALDNESEMYIQKALESVMRGRTSLVIAHRLSTIESADLIVVMEQGAVREQGTHSDLMARGGVYAQLYNRDGFEA